MTAWVVMGVQLNPKQIVTCMTSMILANKGLERIYFTRLELSKKKKTRFTLINPKAGATLPPQAAEKSYLFFSFASCLRSSGHCYTTFCS